MRKHFFYCSSYEWVFLLNYLAKQCEIQNIEWINAHVVPLNDKSLLIKKKTSSRQEVKINFMEKLNFYELLFIAKLKFLSAQIKQ